MIDHARYAQRGRRNMCEEREYIYEAFFIKYSPEEAPTEDCSELRKSLVQILKIFNMTVIIYSSYKM